MNIYVGNLPHATKEEEIRELFSEFGTVTSVKLVIDRETNRSRGFAFVDMDSKESTEAAISALDGTELGGRTLRVNEAKPREPRAFGGGNGGGRSGGGFNRGGGRDRNDRY